MDNKGNHDHGHKVRVIEQCQVGPPPGSVLPTSLPLNFFDLPWLYAPVICKRIFFYDFPYSTDHFLQTVIPNLKHSLSLTLQHFFPLSSNIVFPPKPHKPHILYSQGDTLTFIVAESTSPEIFRSLLSDTTRHVTCLYPIVPILPSPRALEDGTLLIPSMAIQVTMLPNSGFTICTSFRHEAADGRAFHNFMKFWASACGSKGELALPLHGRDMIQDPNGLKPIFLEALWNCPIERIMGLVQDFPILDDMVRRTIVLGSDHVENVKKWVSIKYQSHGLGTLRVSTFLVTSSLIWVCMVKSEVTKVGDTLPNNDELRGMLIWADCRKHPEFSIPSAYFGNCVVSGNAEVRRSKLAGQNGIFEAALAMGSKVRCLQSEPYKEASSLISNFSKFANMGRRMAVIAGSPRLNVYETDFGWGKPKMSEVVHIDETAAISLSDCRDKEGGVEVGIALGRTHMQKFNTILEEVLTEIAVHD